MNAIIRCSSLFILCCALFPALHAQTGDLGYFRRGEKLFLAGNYEDAAQYFERYLSAGKAGRSHGIPLAVEKKVRTKTNRDPRQEAVYDLAECYRREHDYVRSEPLYKKACGFRQAAFPQARYWYGVVLRANGKYADAITALDQFEKEYNEMGPVLIDADRELASLKFIQAQLAARRDGFRLVRQMGGEAGMTSAYAAAVRGGDTVVFTGIHGGLFGGTGATHGGPAAGVVQSGIGGVAASGFRNDLYEAVPLDKDSALLADAQLLNMGDSGGLHNGLATFSADGRRMLFTRWTKRNGVTRSAIWMSNRTDTGWSAAKPFSEANADGYNTTQPFLTIDGRFLLFASDRPGGLGGYDLWYARLDTAFSVTTTTNLGDKINTPGDEQSPFYHANSRTLVFASNGRVGMGGFDIYYSRGNADLSYWSLPVDPGMPLNSSKDDLYYVSTDEDNVWNTGWLSSDRETNCCLALYKVEQNNSQTITGRVVDAATHQPLAGVGLQLTDPRKQDRHLAEGSTDSLGKYRFVLHNVSRFGLAAQKTDYLPGGGLFVVPSETGTDSLNTGDLALERVPVPEVEAVVKHSNVIGNFPYKKSVLPVSARIMLDSLADVLKHEPGTILQIEGYTDGIGGDAYNIRLGQARVDVCIRYLRRKGIGAGQLNGMAYGKCCPVAPDTIDGKDNPAGRELNRRVEYKLIRK
jgi:outer membrane protein OmpA-like peptidoglycan-associated protein/tetratricopeptide (TPR) repeat protein